MSEKLSYEKAISRLEEIIDLLNKNEITLDESLKLFEEGAGLTAQCHKMLEEAEQKITILTEE